MSYKGKIQVASTEAYKDGFSRCITFIRAENKVSDQEHTRCQHDAGMFK